MHKHSQDVGCIFCRGIRPTIFLPIIRCFEHPVLSFCAQQNEKHGSESYGRGLILQASSQIVQALQKQTTHTSGVGSSIWHYFEPQRQLSVAGPLLTRTSPLHTKSVVQVVAGYRSGLQSVPICAPPELDSPFRSTCSETQNHKACDNDIRNLVIIMPTHNDQKLRWEA